MITDECSFGKDLEGSGSDLIQVLSWHCRDSDCLLSGRLEGRSSSPGRVKNFSPLHSVKINSGVHPASYAIGMGASFSGGKAAGALS
jgi:hypothetical protein